MRIKTIQAKDFREALALVKKELGEDAVILSSEDKKRNRPYVEITAAVDYDVTSPHPPFSKGGRGEISKGELNGFSPLINGGFSDELRVVKKEIKSLRETIEAMKDSGYEITLHGERKEMLHFLRQRAIKEKFALQLVERAGGIDDLEVLMSEDIDTSRRQDKRIVMLIGPTGVGKTTTTAKLAAGAIKGGKKVALISIDTYKIGAVEQIRIYSRIIGIPLDIVSDIESLRKSIDKFSDRDLLLIDTTGKNPKDSEYINGLKNIYNTGLPIETQLLLSTSSDCDFLMEISKYYKSLPVDCIAFTKTDEAVKLGSIYNLCLLYRKPVAYITTGQTVPGNIEFVDSKKLTGIVLGTGSA